MSERLAGKVAIVTGSGNGIGQGCALMFAREGATVVGADLDVAGSEETLALAAAEGLTIDSVHPCDLTDPAQVEALMTHTVERHGGLHILLNAAALDRLRVHRGHGLRGPLEEDDRRRAGHRLPRLQGGLAAHEGERRGSIINFSSANAYEALQGSGALAHCATKGAVLAMTRQLAMEGGPHNIRANTICPALIVTSATKPRLDNEPGFRETVEAKMMLDRASAPPRTSRTARPSSRRTSPAG